MTRPAWNRRAGNLAVVLAAAALVVGPIAALWADRHATGAAEADVVELDRVGTNGALGAVDELNAVSRSADAAQAALIAELVARIDALTARVAAVEARLAEAEQAARAATTTTTTGVIVTAAAGAYLGRFRTTCYQLRGTTASGHPAGPGVVAVDRTVIPLGTRIRAEGIGTLIARDVGPAVTGRHLDVWRPSCAGYANPSVDVWRV